jgi:uncharacterized protein YbaP (TraB family)
MRLLRLAATLLFPLTLTLAACTPATHAEPGPAIWRLTDEDSEIWLFGTVHVLPADLKWRNAKIDSAFKSADTLVLETQTDAAALPRIAQLMQDYGYAKDGLALEDRLNADDKARLARVCADLKMDCAALKTLRPWYAANALSVALVMKQGQSLDAGVEQVLQREAAQQSKKVSYFETAEQQVRFFADLPPETELQFLTATLRQIEEEADKIGAIDAAWARGDTAALEKDLNSLLEEAGPLIYAVLIKDRNAAWANEIDMMMKGSGKTFIAVGAAHLVGDDGVPAMLRAKGYKVEGP